MKSFIVIAWKNKEAFLKGEDGKVFRITPGDFHLYYDSFTAAIDRALYWAEQNLKRAKESIVNCEKDLKRLKSLKKHTDFEKSGHAIA